MSKREKAIYKKGVKETLGTIGGIVIWSVIFAIFLVKSGIYVF